MNVDLGDVHDEEDNEHLLPEINDRVQNSEKSRKVNQREAQLESEVQDLQERLNYVERQLKLKTSEATRLKKKTHELE